MCPHVIACVYKWMQYDAVHNYDDCIDRSFAFLRSTPDTTLLVLLPALWCTRGSSTESLKNTHLSGIELNAVDSELILIVLGLGASKKRSGGPSKGSSHVVETDLHEPVPATGPTGQAAHRTASLVISDALLAVQSEPGLGWNEA